MIINFKNINKLKKEEIIFTLGTFDLFHSGHLYFLKSAKNVSPRKKLLVGILSDKQTKDKKGASRPIIGQKKRAEIVDSIKMVDYTFICPSISTAKIVNKVIKEVGPDVSVVTKSSWTGKKTPSGTRLIVLNKELKDYSTTKIIDKIRC